MFVRAKPDERQLLEAIQARTGDRVTQGQTLNGEAVTSAGGTNVPARDLLVQILDDHTGDRGPNGVWGLVWHEEGQQWILNLSFVSALEPQWGPPPAKPVPGEPPRR